MPRFPLIKPATLVFRPKLPDNMYRPSLESAEGNPSRATTSPDPTNPVPSVTQESSVMDPVRTINFVPSYDGDSATLYNYLQSAKQWLQFAGNTPQNVMLLLSKLTGKAELLLTMINHNFQWEIVEQTLKTECGDNRELNTLLIELNNVKKKTTFRDLIFEIKQKLFFLRGKLLDKYNNDASVVTEVMTTYICAAKIALQNNLPYHDQICVLDCDFNSTCEKILLLEASGRFDNIKQKFSNVLPPPRIINKPYPEPNFSNFQNLNRYPSPANHRNGQHQNHTYPPTQRSLMNRFNQNRQPFRAARPWVPNPNNVFTRPQHPFFSNNNNNNNVNANNNNNSHRPVSDGRNDVSMRTAIQPRPNQRPIGRGYVAEEVFHHENEDEFEFDEEYPEYTSDYVNDDYYNDLPDESTSSQYEQNFQQAIEHQDNS